MDIKKCIYNLRYHVDTVHNKNIDRPKRVCKNCNLKCSHAHYCCTIAYKI